MYQRCPHCRGTGRVNIYVFTNLDGQRIELPVSCGKCHGTGVKRDRRVQAQALAHEALGKRR